MEINGHLKLGWGCDQVILWLSAIGETQTDRQTDGHGMNEHDGRALEGADTHT